MIKRPVKNFRTRMTAAITLVLVTTFAARTDILIDRKESRSIHIGVTGTITSRDAEKLEEMSQELAHGAFTVFLNSEGGEVSAAFKIGRLIRKYDGTTAIPAGSKCYSSCALIFIAGVKRINFGEIGLHRPYFASAPQNRQILEKQVPLMLSLIKSYIAEMGITDNFYQQMVNTEPLQVIKYGSSDYKILIPESDPVYEEVEIAYEARQYGITTSEMRQRNENAEKCNGFPDISRRLTCEEAIKWGLSERVYEQRQQKVSVCGLRDDEAKIADAVPTKERRDHPIWVRAENCARKIMLSPDSPR
jgi:hypothetical protein